MKKYKIGLFIFRRDLRIDYNNGFSKCLRECEKIIPIFIFTHKQIIKNTFKSDKSVQFMIESLSDLNQQLQKHNGQLYTFFGDNYEIIEKLIKKYNIESIFLNKDYTPYSKQRDTKIQHICNKHNIDCNSYHDVCLFPPGSISTDSGETYQKFTPFYNKCLTQLHVIERKNNTSFHSKWFFDNLKSTFFISLKDAYLKLTKPTENVAVTGGREHGLAIIKQMKAFSNYENCRDQLTYQTTYLSAYLKYGCVSVIEVFHKLMSLDNSKNPIIRQLIWRDFYIHILDAFPRVLQGKSLKEKYDAIQWNNNKTWFNHWKKGTTGFPVVDACMRQLNTTGYMHNRGRLIVASFLIKNLQIDWRWGEKYFAQNLVDYDPAANNGNWQWVAGSGADSQPYFRIFNPWTQSEKFDKDCLFIKQWCPELKDVDNKHIHQWDSYYQEYSTIQYPKPMIDYKESREKAIQMYKKYL
jgi:deoxyribodipyrimidine photo-lyase